MADYKDYIVRYDIIADVTKAAEGLQSIANIAKEFEAPMNTLKTAITQVSQSVNQLKQNSQIKFAPEISTSQFSNQLRKMVTETENAAAKMHAAIFNALSGNPLGKKVAQKGSANGFQLAKGSQALKSQLDSNLKLIEEQSQRIQGLQKTLRTSLTDTQKENAEKSLRSAQIIKKGLQAQNKDILAALKEAEETEKQVAKASATASKTKTTKSKSTPVKTASRSVNSPSAKLTNVTPAVIREWERVFGNSKSKALTIKIRGNATGADGALTVIEKIQTSLKTLQSQGTFNINPILNTEGFAAAEAQLKRLAGLSTAVVAPFTPKDTKTQTGKPSSLVSALTKDEKTKLTNAKKQIKAWNEKIAPIQSRLDANRAIPENQRTPAIKGQITRDTKKLAAYQANKAEQENIVRTLQGKSTATARNPITATVDTKNIVSQLQNIPRQTIPVAIRLMWERGAVGRQEQLKKITSNIPPVKLNFDTTTAIAKLEEFVAKVRAASPQNIKLTATGVPPAGAQQNVTAPATNTVPSATGGTTQKSQKQSGHTGHQPLTPRQYRDQLGAHLAKSGMLPPNYATQIADQQRRRAWQLDKMKRDAMAAFEQKTPYELAEEERLRKSAQTNPKGKPSKFNIQKAARLQTQAQNAMLPFAQSKAQLNMLTKHRRYFRQAVATTGIMPTPGMEAPQMLKYLQGVSTQMQKASVAVPWTLQSQINKLEGDVAKANGVGQPTQYRGTGMSPMGTGQQKPFFDRSRKWAYPFTGQTSFGARTPMAVDMAKGMGVMFAIGGAMSAIGGSFSQAMEYQNTMRTTQAILQNGTDSYSQNSFKNMEATVRNVGVKTKFSAPEVANAAKFLAMAGYDIEGINAAIRPIADLALIGDYDLGETADKMTNIMTTFGAKPEDLRRDPQIMRRYANIMATTATRSNTDLMMLAESAKYGGGVANMYGRNDPNLFADTMALFGVMGNAGIQASSAGTSLRMMYQNIFNPNKKQAAVLNLLKSKYNVSTKLANGQNRSMADIIIDMANKIPADVMPDIVGQLFRITAQSGANTALMSAIDIATQESGGDANMVANLINETNAFVDKISGKNSKSQLSALASLIQANRNSVSGNISGAIAEEKQNTISGLWAQVTSTFTEGIVQAFENRQGGFEEMLKKLRDYLAKPETIQMIQNLLDMIIEIGEVMAWFVKIWASLYNTAPGLIKTWVTVQMLFTQFGTLVAPIISLIGVFDRLKGSIIALAGISSVGGSTMTGNVTRNAIAGTAANAALLVPTPGASQKFAGKIGSKVNSAMATNAILAGELALSGASKSSTLKTLNQETALHYKAVQERYYRRYGWARAGAAFRTAQTAGLTMASFAPMFGGLKSMVMNLFVGLSRAIGLLANPISIAIIAIASLGFGLYKLKKIAYGETEAQILARQQMAKLSEEAAQTMVKNYKWYQEQMDNFKNPAQHLDSVGKSESQREYEGQAENFRSEYADIIKGDLSKNASKKEIRQQVQAFRERVDKNRLYKYAFGEDYDKYMGSGLTEDNSSMKYTGTYADGGIALYNLLFAPKRHAKEVQNREIQAALRTAGVNHPAIQAAHEQIVQLRKQYLGGDLTESQYLDQAYAIRDKVVNPNDPRLKSSTGLTLKEFQNISDPSRYKEYALGQFNVLNSFITGEDGTIVAKLNAQHALRNKLVVSGEQYWQAISNVIGDYPIQFKAVSMDEKIVKDLDITLSMLPDGNGRIDFNAVYNTIQSAVGDFQKNIEDFANMAAKVYQLMANAGLVPSTEEGMKSFVWNQVEHSHITKDQAAKYYHDYLPKNSIWKQSGKSLEEFQEFVTNPTGEVIINGKKYSAASQRVAMRRRLTDNAVNSMMETVNKYKPKGTSTTSTTGSQSNADGGSQSKTDQQAYASHYDRSAARPTQVVFNINNLANFDRTTVASSAEERDLMAAMEGKIAGAVYQMFAEASNQAQRVIDLT